MPETTPVEITIELPPSVTKALKDLEELKAQIAKNAEHQDDVPGFTMDLAAAQTANAEIEKKLNEVRDTLTKALEDRTKELQDSYAEVEKLHKQQRREKFIRRSRELQALPGTQADDFAETLDLLQAGLAKTVPDRAEKIFAKFNEKLTSWNVLIEKNNLLFQEIGQEGGDLGMLSGAEAQMMMLAKEKQNRDPKLTYEKAFTLVMQEQPKLYRKYQAE